MLTHALLAALASLVTAAAPQTGSTSTPGQGGAVETPLERSAHELRTSVHDALRRQAIASHEEQPAAVHGLVAIYNELNASSQMPAIDRKQLLAVVRGRLRRVADELARDGGDTAAAAEAAQPSGPVLAPPENRAILAQKQGKPLPPPPANQAAAPGNFPAANRPASPAANLAAATAENADQLIELIQTAIAAASWDVRGGPGTIRFFAPRQVLVVRQRDDVHEHVGQVLEALRGN